MNNPYFLLEVYNRSFPATIPGLITNSSYTYTKKQYFWHQNPTAKPSFRSALVYAIPTSWTSASYSSICSGPTLSRTKTSHQAPIQVPANTIPTTHTRSCPPHSSSTDCLWASLCTEITLPNINAQHTNR